MQHISWVEVRGAITGTGPGHLSTASASGVPHVSTVFAVVDGEGLVFTMRVGSGKHQNLLTNPHCALMWQGNGAETYVWAEVSLTNDQQLKSRLWNDGLFPFDLSMFYEDETSDDWVIAELRPMRATVMAQTDNGLVRQVWTADAS